MPPSVSRSASAHVETQKILAVTGVTFPTVWKKMIRRGEFHRKLPRSAGERCGEVNQVTAWDGHP